MLYNNEMQPIDLIEVLIDSYNNDPIVLVEENGSKLIFNQVAVVPIDVNDIPRLYTLLKPVGVDGVADDECMVFRVVVDKDANTDIRIEEDEILQKAVYAKYLELVMWDSGEDKGWF